MARNPELPLKNKLVTPPEDHPFAPFVRALGRGANLSRALTEDEAEAAMAMILAGEARPIQIGAFLMLLRYRGESAAELAGFVRAARARLARPSDAARPDLDWPSYADRHRQLPWFVLAALLLAENGVRVLMHGIRGYGTPYAPTGAALARLGIAPCGSLTEAARRLAGEGFAYVTLDALLPELDALLDLRPLLGLRSPVNTLARELNPLAAPCTLQGVFHPGYRERHLAAARLLGQPGLAVFKGGGGEVQRNPGKGCEVLTLAGGREGRESWPALLDRPYRWRGEALAYDRLAALWSGECEAAAPRAAVVGTAALALRLLGRAADPAEAEAMAAAMWADRRREKFALGLASAVSDQA